MHSAIFAIFDFFIKIVSSIWDKRVQVWAVIRSLRSRTRALVALIIFFVLGLSLALTYFYRANAYASVVAKTLNTRHRGADNPALQNLLLSSIGEEVGKDLADERLDSDFRQTWNEIIDTTSRPYDSASQPAKDTPPKPPVDLAHQPTKDTAPKPVDLAPQPTKDPASKPVDLDPQSTKDTASKPVDLAPQPIKLVAGSSVGEILTEARTNSAEVHGEKPGFLFLPYFILSPQLKKRDEISVFEERKTLDLLPSAGKGLTSDMTSDGVAALVNKRASDGEIAVPSYLHDQVIVTQQLATAMQKLASISFVSANGHAGKYLSAIPVQSYIVLSSGVMRAFVHDELYPTKYYGNQFPPTTFFPSRPYFWSTLVDHPSFYSEVIPSTSYLMDTESDPSHKQMLQTLLRTKNELGSDVTVGEFFRISQPYLDLGGSGIVVTLTRGLIIDGVARAVICIDLRFDENNSVTHSFENAIGPLNPEVFEVNCSMGRGSQELECDEEKTLLGKREKLFHEVKNEFSRSSTDILGTLYRFDEGTEIRLSVPLNRQIRPDGSQSITLMLASFDPTVYMKHNNWLAALASTSFGLLFSLFAYLWGSLEVTRAQYEEAFQRVDLVMEHSPTPYARLDNEDIVVVANESLRNMLDSNLGKSSSQKRTLKSFCWDDISKKQYDEVEAKRRKNEQVVTPYPLTLTGRDGQPVKVEIYSAAIPSDSGGLPNTFGILLQNS